MLLSLRGASLLVAFRSNTNKYRYRYQGSLVLRSVYILTYSALSISAIIVEKTLVPPLFRFLTDTYTAAEISLNDLTPFSSYSAVGILCITTLPSQSTPSPDLIRSLFLFSLISTFLFLTYSIPRYILQLLNDVIQNYTRSQYPLRSISAIATSQIGLVAFLPSNASIQKGLILICSRFYLVANIGLYSLQH